MNDKFDELAKNMAQSVTRRQALRRFTVGLAGVVIGSLGAANTSRADPWKPHCKHIACDCSKAYGGCGFQDYACLQCCGPYCG